MIGSRVTRLRRAERAKFFGAAAFDRPFVYVLSCLKRATELMRTRCSTISKEAETGRVAVQFPAISGSAISFLA